MGVSDEGLALFKNWKPGSDARITIDQNSVGLLIQEVAATRKTIRYFWEKQAGQHLCGCTEWPECSHTLAAHGLCRATECEPLVPTQAPPPSKGAELDIQDGDRERGWLIYRKTTSSSGAIIGSYDRRLAQALAERDAALAENAEIKKAFGHFACEVMGRAIEGIADAAIIKHQPMNESHALAAVEQLAKRAKPPNPLYRQPRGRLRL